MRQRVEVAVIEGIDDIAREDWNALLGRGRFALSSIGTGCTRWRNPKARCATTGWAPYHLVVRDRGEESSSRPARSTSRATAWASSCSTTDGPTRPSAPASVTIPKLLVGVPFTPHTRTALSDRARHRSRAPLVAALGRALIQLCADNKLSSVHVNFCDRRRSRGAAPNSVSSSASATSTIGATPASPLSTTTSAQLKSKRRYCGPPRARRARRARASTIKVLAGDEIPDTLFGPMYRSLSLDHRKALLGPPISDARIFRPDARALQAQRVPRSARIAGAKLVAGTFNLQKAGVLYGRYWGCFEDLKFLHFNVCYYAAIEHCIEQRNARFEPGAGGEYKWLRGFDPALTRSMHYHRASRIAQGDRQLPRRASGARSRPGSPKATSAASSSRRAPSNVEQP